ncbi:MAG: thioredoxin domain-containing protein [Chlorobi bacterium]|nr:thioredoxin domain-containing protein [Chlorobiota bacterium]
MNSRNTQPNRLAQEKSPYLLQHAGNPVDWHPWGEAAFSEARARNLPIFLSIGYATCHWCHVMERESFENERIAGLLNRHFIPVKVDREEHPDLDRLYMTYVQASTGRGGWPMSVWLTPDLQPFYGGSYFPPEDRYGMPGFGTILRSLAELWANDRNRLKAASAFFFEQLRKDTGHLSEAPFLEENEAQEACFEWLKAAYDPLWGGFGPAPKFPRPAVFSFLFSHAFHTGSREAEAMALHTLQKMAEGGMHDQLGIPGKGGGGFARYSTDERWHLPHFEKMLYDNAQLALGYIEAFQISGERFFASVAEDTINYALHEMQSSEGGFYSAEDADSFSGHESPGKTEGAFYVWTWEELFALPEPKEHLELFSRVYGMKREGNIVNDPHGEFTRKNVLMQALPSETGAKEAGLDEAVAAQALERIRELLYAKRLLRPRPLCDDKIITSWNGLMISALAKGFRVLERHEYLDAARRAADFVLGHLCNERDKRLLRRYRDGQAAIAGKAEDYAFLIRALLDLYQACFDNRYLETAIALQKTQNRLFFDHESGGYYSTAIDDDTVPVRLKEEYDGAEPAATSVGILNLQDIALLTGNERYNEMAEACFRSFSGMLSLNSHALPLMLAAMNRSRKGGILAVLSGDRESAEMGLFLRKLNRPYLPGMTIMHASAKSLPEITVSEGIEPDAPTPAVHLCQNRSCRLPAETPEAAEKLLLELTR